MKRVSTAVMILLMILGMTAYGEERVDTLTYAVFPYLPDPAYYQELIELRWHEVEPDIQLIRAEWDCYKDGVPEGVDVVMYDAVMLDTIAAAGWIQPIDPNALQNLGDIFPFALEGLAINGKMYGIPVFLCGNFLIYDQDCEALAAAEHITDLAGMSEILVINSEIFQTECISKLFKTWETNTAFAINSNKRRLEKVSLCLTNRKITVIVQNDQFNIQLIVGYCC